MAKSASFNKRELEKKKEQKRTEKLQRKEIRKSNTPNGNFEDMIAYVDANGVITDTPPDITKKQDINAENILVSTPKQEYTEPVPLIGRVEHFNTDKGFGFIKDVSTTDKYFFHISNAPSTIAEGNMVTFELERGQKGLNAVRIILQPTK